MRQEDSPRRQVGHGVLTREFLLDLCSFVAISHSHARNYRPNDEERKAKGEKRAIGRRCDSGAMLLAVLFMMAMMVITAMAVAPAIIQQAKRDREEEMIHRGTEYARGIKKYYKRFGRYPANIEQLENTNNMRFIRKKFKDPLVQDGQWKLLHYGDLQSLVGGAGFLVPGVGGVQPNQQGLGGVQPNQQGNPFNSALGATPTGVGSNPGSSNLLVGAQPSPQQQSGFVGDQQQNPAQPVGGTSGATQGHLGSTLSSGSSGSTDQSQNQNQGNSAQTGTNNSMFGNAGVGGQTFGGGAIGGVASKSKDPTMRIYNKKKTYDEWQFIYSPMLDRQNTLLQGPYNGQTLAVGQFGTQPGQLNPGQLNQGLSPQAPGGVGQQPGAYGQPNTNQQLTPGTQYPPEQQPQPPPQ